VFIEHIAKLCPFFDISTIFVQLLLIFEQNCVFTC